MVKPKTEEVSSRKYPNVIWFPRSKTDMREFREVLKIATIVESEQPQHYFNDKLLGKKMAEIGLINRVGMLPEDYIESYNKKSIGDVSYITNARMLMRIFRFLGWVAKKERSQYVLTKRGLAHSLFEGDFPDNKEGFNEEEAVLNSLKDFTFYSPNDTIENRDLKFKIRPFIWLLYNLNLEPQCMYQLIVTCFASKREDKNEIKRIKSILDKLRRGETNLKKEFKILGLDADDYSCVHNFYDSAKILVYIGTKLGLIEKENNPKYGKAITGNATNMKQASIFYKLTEKGKNYLSKNIGDKVIFYDDIQKALSKEEVLYSSLLLAILNFELKNKRLVGISRKYLKSLFSNDLDILLTNIKDKLKVKLIIDKEMVKIDEKISFNLWQSVPYEETTLESEKIIQKFYEDFNNNSKDMKIELTSGKIVERTDLIDKFVLSDKVSYNLPTFTDKQKAIDFVSYQNKNKVYGGQDRFSTRVSPTNSLFIVNGLIKLDPKLDSFDLISVLRFPSKELKKFIDENLNDIINKFIEKSSSWYKDQHYVWIRNCFRLFGCEAIYSGSSGMLMRADVSITSPFIGGIEAKSPTENRGSVTSKAIRQANHAKLQLNALYHEDKKPSIAIAIGRRITPQAINEEKDVFRPNNQPVLIISDRTLFYLSLKFPFLSLNEKNIINLFTENHGHLTSKNLLGFFEKMKQQKQISEQDSQQIIKELNEISINSD